MTLSYFEIKAGNKTDRKQYLSARYNEKCPINIIKCRWKRLKRYETKAKISEYIETNKNENIMK